MPPHIIFLRIAWREKAKNECFARFSFLTYVHLHGDFICFTAFHGRDYILSGREGEEKQCPGGRLPLNAGELTVLHLLVFKKLLLKDSLYFMVLKISEQNCGHELVILSIFCYPSICIKIHYIFILQNVALKLVCSSMERPMLTAY